MTRLQGLLTIAALLIAPSIDAAPRWVRPPVNDTVVIFMHGLWGNAEGTWRSKANTDWPDMLARDDRFRRVDVYVAEYPTERGKPGLTIPQITAQLSEPLREIFDSHSRVVFICHSMGGIVVRQLMVKYPWARTKVKMIYFYGTPMDGSHWAWLAALIFPDRAVRQLISGEYLDELTEEWLAEELQDRVKSYCAYETQPQPPRVIVSEKSSERLCNRELIPLSSDHSNLVKPTGVSDLRYVVFANAFTRELLGGVPSAALSASPPAFASPPTTVSPTNIRTADDWMRDQLDRFNSRLPPPPGTLSAASICDAHAKPVVHVEWSEVKGADYYLVRRSGRDVYSATKTEFEDRDVGLGISHSYGVQACSADGCGLASPLFVSSTLPERCGANTPPRCGSITQSKERGEVPLKVRFSVVPTDPDGDTPHVWWMFGDGRYIGGLDHVEHSFTAPGTYEVKATVSDGVGGVGTCSANVVVTGKALDPIAADDLWFQEWQAEPGSPFIAESPKVGPPETEFRFKARIPERYGTAVAYRWNFRDNATLGGEWSEWSTSPEISHRFKTYSHVATETVLLGVKFSDGRSTQMGGTTIVVRRR